MFQIREATAEDMSLVAEIWNKGYPLKPTTASELQRQLTFEPHLRPTTWIGLLDGEPIGIACLERNIGSYHPLKWMQFTAVLPRLRRRGFGNKLWDHARSHVAPGVLSIGTMFIEEDDEPSIRFAEARGFREVKRDFESELTLSDFEVPNSNPPPGYQIASIAASDTPKVRRDFHATFEIVRADVPRFDPPSPMDFEFLMSETFDYEDLLAGGSQLAFFGDQLVGFATIYKGAESATIEQGLTAVLREHRGTGIAKALKVAGILWAKAAGFERIRTDNDTRNAPMLAINEALGYRRLKGTLTMLWEPDTDEVPPVPGASV